VVVQPADGTADLSQSGSDIGADVAAVTAGAEHGVAASLLLLLLMMLRTYSTELTTKHRHA